MNHRYTTILRSSLVLFTVLLPVLLNAQSLRPGFDREEYVELLRVNMQQYDSLAAGVDLNPVRFKRQYRSKVMGLDNRWELWTSSDSVAAISLRGTTANSVSWLENFYAAMVPATGKLQLTDSISFTYQLADHPRAAVHVGWLTGMAFLAQEIVPVVDSLAKLGIRDFAIIGHSQGGALAYLLTSHLYGLRRANQLPADVRLKTYCSAAPKPGNLYYAYDYEAATQGGWAFNVVNSADWVPETPFSIQTLDDVNTVNPFKNLKKAIRKQKFPRRAAYRYVYNHLTKPTYRARRNYQKYLGKAAARLVAKNIPGYRVPDFYNSNHYVRTGQTIVLLADEAYYRQFPNDEQQVFMHHGPQPYLFLAGRLKYPATE